MPTGAAWIIEGEPPEELVRATAWFDKDAIVDIPLSWVAWLADKETTYSSHSVTTHPDLECTNPTTGESGGVIKVRIKKNPAGADLVVNRTYWFTCHIVASDGQEDDQTLYLKIGAK
jgi:hypothetical protein